MNQKNSSPLRISSGVLDILSDGVRSNDNQSRRERAKADIQRRLFL